MGWEQLPVLCIHLTPTTFQQLSLPIRIVVHVIIVILFSKTSPLSVSLPARGGGGHILHFLMPQPGGRIPNT